MFCLQTFSSITRMKIFKERSQALLPILPPLKGEITDWRKDFAFLEEIYKSVQLKLSEGKEFGLVAWAFKYGDTRPFSESSPVGILFLTTNVFYFLSTVGLWQIDKSFLANIFAFFVDLAGFASLSYHRNQLKYGPNQIEVYLPLFFDYCAALLACTTSVLALYTFYSKGFIYDAHVSAAFEYGIISAVFFVASWKWDVGISYIVLHGLWHLFSALSVAEIGEAEKVLHAFYG